MGTKEILMHRGFALVFFVVAACSHNPDPSQPTASPDGLGKQLQGNGQGPDVNPDPPAASCGFKVGDTCFASAEAACKAAGCDLSACLQLETMPVQIECKK
jgi:hypothetical protein